jgi:hypothetical protein
MGAAGYGPLGLLNAMAVRGVESKRASRALLGQIPWPEHQPPLLADSGVTVVQTVNNIKKMWQRRFVAAFVFSACILFVIIFILLRQNQREVRAGWAAHADTDAEPFGKRKRAYLDAIYLLLVLAGFLFGLIQLITFVRW